MMSKKSFSPNTFIGDMGQMPEYVSHWYACKDLELCLEKIVEGFADLRFFLPLLVEYSDGEETGFVLDTFAGEKVLLAFSNIEDFSKVFPTARPMPILGKDLVSLALRLQVGRILLDKDNKNLLIGRQAVYCMSAGSVWTPAWKNEQLANKLGEVLKQIEAAKGYQIRLGKRCETEILIAFDCDKDEVSMLVEEVKEILSHFNELLQSTDSIEIIPFKA